MGEFLSRAGLLRKEVHPHDGGDVPPYATGRLGNVHQRRRYRRVAVASLMVGTARCDQRRIAVPSKPVVLRALRQLTCISWDYTVLRSPAGAKSPVTRSSTLVERII